MAGMDIVAAALLLLVGLGAGSAIGWLAAGRGQATGQVSASAVTAERDALRQERDALRAERDAALGAAQQAQSAHVAAQATLEAERRAAAEKLIDLEGRFQVLSQKVMEENRTAFLDLAEQRLKLSQTEQVAELEKREKAVETLVKPLSESLSKVQEHVSKVELDRTKAYAELTTQVEQMRTTSDQLRVETQQLVTALRRPQVRGQWGEQMLRRTVEAAGMVKHVHFVEQLSVTDGEGTLQRPDLVVNLSDGKQVVVDSKVSFNGFLEAMEATDDAVRAERLKAHARHLRTHIEQLAAKEYWAQFDSTPEFVVLFVPADTFLNAALEQDPTLMEHGYARNVVIATPSTLVAMLRTIGYCWRQEALARNAHEVLKLGKDLHGRLATMGGHITKLGSSLNNSVDAYNKTVSSLETRVLVTARKLAELEVVDAELDAPTPVDTLARQVQRDELVASATDALVALPDASARGVAAALEAEAELLAAEIEAGESASG
jgi:DNA recombination protein RmuC